MPVCICCVCVCITHAANTLQHLGRSLRPLGNDWSGNTHLASGLKRDGEEEEGRVRKMVGKQTADHKDKQKTGQKREMVKGRGGDKRKPAERAGTWDDGGKTDRSWDKEDEETEEVNKPTDGQRRWMDWRWPDRNNRGGWKSWIHSDSLTQLPGTSRTIRNNNMVKTQFVAVYGSPDYRVVKGQVSDHVSCPSLMWTHGEQKVTLTKHTRVKSSIRAKTWSPFSDFIDLIVACTTDWLVVAWLCVCLLLLLLLLLLQYGFGLTLLMWST